MRLVAWALCRGGFSDSVASWALLIRRYVHDNDAMVESEIAEFNNAQRF